MSVLGRNSTPASVLPDCGNFIAAIRRRSFRAIPILRTGAAEGQAHGEEHANEGRVQVRDQLFGPVERYLGPGLKEAPA